MIAVDLHDRWKHADAVHFREVAGELVLLDMNGGDYFGLNAVGAAFWAEIGTGKTIAQTVDALLKTFQVDRSVLEADLVALAAELAERRLLIKTP